jgi:lysophospholipase L1-like esterase
MHSTSTLQIVLCLSLTLLQVEWSVDGQLPSSRSSLTIVHLGDSFSSGAGARDTNGDAIWIGPSSCFRSPFGWGQRLADSLNETYLVNYTNSACGGATLSSIMSTIQRRYDQIPAQIDSIHKDVDYILMSVGANDLGFKELLLGCFMKGLRDVGTCREQINNVRSGYAAFGSDLIEALLFIEQSLNPDDTNLDAKLVFVSYPHTITSPSYYLRDKFSDDTIDISTEIRQVLVNGDALLRSTITEVNEMVGREYVVFFDRTKDLFNGHEPDPSYEIENPDGWFWEFKVEDRREWYHMNTEGHVQLGEAISSFFKDNLLVAESMNDDFPCTYSFWCPLWTVFFHLFSFSNSSLWT